MGLKALAKNTLGAFWDDQKYEFGWEDATRQSTKDALYRTNLAYKQGYDDGLASRLLTLQSGRGGYKCTYCQKGHVEQLPGKCNACGKYLARTLD